MWIRLWSQNYDGEILVIPKEYNRAYEKNFKSLNLYLSKWERINENSMPPTIKCGKIILIADLLI